MTIRQFSRYRMPYRFGIALFLLALLAVCRPVASAHVAQLSTWPVDAPASRACAYVVLAGVINGNWDIVALDRQHGLALNLTQSPDDERGPSISPDGRTIAFAAHHDHNWDVYTMDFAAGSLHRLTDDPAYDGQPAWSPDGMRVAFESYRDGNLEIYTMPAHGGPATRVTTEPAADVGPIWTADGEGLIIGSWRSGARQLYRADLASGQSTTPDEDASQPALSPDGQRLAYVSTHDTTRRLAIRNLTSGEVVLDSADDNQREWPAWMPSAGRSSLLALELTGGGPYHYPTGWSLNFMHGDVHNGWTRAQTLPGQWERPSCLAADMPLKGAWQPLAHMLGTHTAPDTMIPRGLAMLPNVQALQPRLAAAVTDSFMRLRQRTRDASGHDFLGVLNDAWRDLDHPSAGFLSWHKTGRAMDLRDWYAPGGQQTLFIARQILAGQTYFRIYLRAARQDGSQGMPLRENLWQTDGRLARPDLAAAGGQALAPPRGYFVDFTDLAEREGWTRIPALTPPDGDWRHTYLDLEFWHYEHRDGLNWYTAMQHIYDDGELRRRFTTRLALQEGYSIESLVGVGLPDTPQWLATNAHRHARCPC
ncbi:MAG TPA: hypothetical protein VFT66_14675 [Roseiflexaceae bacterium]|nr:hypothetical protein [Roseiflexaceae bacterium]